VIRGVYLAYPIDQRGPASLDYLFQQIERLKIKLIEAQAVAWVFDPGDAFRVNPRAGTDRMLPTINRAALNQSDLVIAFMPAGVPSVGVPMEIDRAVSQGKHVIVVSDAPSYMLELPRIVRIGDWTDAHIDHIVDTIAATEPMPMERPREDLRVVVDVEGCLPKRAYEDDAGLDLVVSDTTFIRPGQFADVPCGVSVELPSWSWGLVTGRSSALRKRGLLVHTGVIDAGYRGPLYAGAWNMTEELVRVEKGERIAQLIIHNNSTRYVDPIRVEYLSESARGSNGFGSSGK
jgi:dUTP pyrophosphatase